MSDLINRQAALNSPVTMVSEGLDWIPAYHIKDLPASQPERKTGRWIPQDHNRRSGYVTTTVYYYPKCSECGHSGNYDMSYCPNCGARMEGDAE